MNEQEKREGIFKELARIDSVQWMHNVERNTDITINVVDLAIGRHYVCFCYCRRTREVFFYGQSAKYPGGDKWRFEDVDTPALECIVGQLQEIERSGRRLPFPEEGRLFASKV